MNLKPNHFIITEDKAGIFITKVKKKTHPTLTFTLEDTHGCSCTQILDLLNVGVPPEKGCPVGLMKCAINWFKSKDFNSAEPPDCDSFEGAEESLFDRHLRGH